jgi:hypothetical protein
MKATFDHLVVKAFRGQDAATLAHAPLDALHGVSSEDAHRLREAFGIETVGDLARHRFVAAAQAIAAAADGRAHDPGPDAAWEAFFASAPLAAYQDHPQDFRLDFGPVWYRGRLDGTARLLVIGQDPAANELVGHRVFVGDAGQRLQGFLRRLGIMRDYLVVNTFLYPIFGQFGDVAVLARSAPIKGFRDALLSRIAGSNPLEAIITVGAAGADAADSWSNRPDLPVCQITHPSARDHARLLANWNVGLTHLRGVVAPEVGVFPNTDPYGNAWAASDEEPIPRRDLPFGVPEWHGAGDHATRGRQSDGKTDPKTIVWTAP